MKLSPPKRKRPGRLLEGTERLRAIRALEVLEHVGTLRAQEVLKAIAAGMPAARLTKDAKASLERLAKRAGGGP